MERIILNCEGGTCEGDNYNYVIPVLCESYEQFCLDFIDGKIDMYKMFGSVHELELHDILTLDEWFSRNSHQYL